MADASDPPQSAAEKLVGVTLLKNWIVEKRLRREEGLSGGSRSCCYRAKSLTGELAFIKAFDFHRELVLGDTEQLESMLREFNHERNVHKHCADLGISRVTRILGAGKVAIDGEAVNFIVCEWAEKCLREEQPPGDARVSAKDRFIALRDAASALSQLHAAGVAHQDVKPSNAVCYGDSNLKLTDLGSSSCESMASPPHDQMALVGQPNYAPYELLYGQPIGTWRGRRFGCDLFLLGNLCFTSFVGSSLTIAALHFLPDHLRHVNDNVRYDEVIPYLLEAHQLLIPSLLGDSLSDDIRDEVVQLVMCLCHPNPLRRGHAKNLINGTAQFGLERFISRFNALAIKASLGSRGSI